MKKVNFFRLFLFVVIVAAVALVGWKIIKDRIRAAEINDYTKGIATSEKGNTIGNYANGGYLCERDGWIYYSDPNDQGRLHKMKQDLSADQKLNNDWPDRINVTGGKIYYINENDRFSLYSCDLNGKNSTRISDNVFLNLYVKDGWAYYARKKSKNLNRMTLDGKFEERIDVDSFTYSIIEGDWVYYCNLDDGFKIYRVKTDNSSKQKFNDISSFNFQLQGDWIYYTNLKDKNKLYRAKRDGSSKQRLTSCAVANLNLNDTGKVIFYCNADDQYKLYRCDFDGKNTTKMNNDETTCINLAGGFIHYLNESDFSRLYRINQDGTGRIRLEK